MITKAHLTKYQPEDNINIKRGNKFRDVIALLFAKTKGRSVDIAFRRKWTKY